MAYDLGDLVGLAISVKDASGTAANATAVTCTITLPDGTTATPTVTNAATGSYTVDYSPTLSGRHLVRWVATGTNASSYTDTFEVDDPADLPVISLSDAKAYLNVTSTSGDEEIRGFILAATDVAERLTSRTLRRRSVVESYSISGGYFSLNTQPVISVTSVVENSVTLAATDYVVDTRVGVIYRGTSVSPLYWAAGTDNIVVTYVAGESTPSPTAQLLVKELTRHLWRTQRGASPMAMGGSDEFVPGSANIMTYRIQELAGLLAIPTVA
jgi:hypothetical protein